MNGRFRAGSSAVRPINAPATGGTVTGKQHERVVERAPEMQQPGLRHGPE